MSTTIGSAMASLTAGEVDGLQGAVVKNATVSATKASFQFTTNNFGIVAFGAALPAKSLVLGSTVKVVSAFFGTASAITGCHVNVGSQSVSDLFIAGAAIHTTTGYRSTSNSTYSATGFCRGGTYFIVSAQTPVVRVSATGAGFPPLSTLAQGRLIAHIHYIETPYGEVI